MTATAWATVTSVKLVTSCLQACCGLWKSGTAKGRSRLRRSISLLSTTLAGKTYLNVIDGGEQRVKLLEEKGWKPEVVGSYFIFRYQVDGDKLLVWMMDDDAKERAIKAGKIKGVVGTWHSPNTTKFTDTTEKLARLVTQAGDGLFSKEPMLRFERIDGAKKP